MGVGVQREGHIGMSQDTRQRLGVHAAGECMSGEGMSEIVEADAGQTRTPQQCPHVVIGGAGIYGVFRLDRVREDPLADGFPLAPPQNIRSALGKNDGAHTLLGFRFTDGVLALRSAVECTAYFQRAARLIEVAPLQATDLALAQSGGQLGVEEVPPDLILLNGFHESIQFLVSQNSLGLIVCLGSGSSLGWVLRDDMRLHRVLHRLMEQGVDVVDHSVGELVAVLRMVIDAPLFFRRRYILWMSCVVIRDICL